MVSVNLSWQAKSPLIAAYEHITEAAWARVDRGLEGRQVDLLQQRGC